LALAIYRPYTSRNLSLKFQRLRLYQVIEVVRFIGVVGYIIWRKLIP